MTNSDMLRSMPFPFPDGRFPDALGAVVQRTVLDGEEPARIVIHDADGDWAVGDGVNDPNEPGASIATHMHHVVARDPSVAELATMALGHVAERAASGDPWAISRHSYD
jgi:hypothetical protein